MAQVMSELFVRDVSDGSFAEGSSWESVGEFVLAQNSARLQMAVRAAQDGGQTWLTVDRDEHRYHGKCKGCKRPVTRLLRERVALGQRDGRPWVKRNAVDLADLNADATLVSCPDCGRGVRLSRLNGKLNADHACDARCTGAKGSNCECACGGANHGSAWAA